jgi:N-acetylglucosaminyl-diphospho-decaprenol L-rhamnosyltransferase
MRPRGLCCNASTLKWQTLDSGLGNLRTLVVIVNYRTADLAVAALRSLAPEALANVGTQVVVVDNASGDGSYEQVDAAIRQQGWSAWARAIASARNGGFAAGNNLAIDTVRATGRLAEYIWLVNPDAQVRPGSLGVLLNFMQQHPRAGIAGGSMEDASGHPWPYAFRFPSVWSEINDGLRLGLVSRLLDRRIVLQRMGHEPQRVDWICGANFMVRGAMVEQIGSLDDGYFLYFEETDYCRRAARAGWECWYVPQARVMHIVGQSTGLVADGRPQRRRPAYWFESRRRYFVKNHGRAYTMVADLAWMVCFATWRLRRFIQRKPDNDPPGMLVDFARHSVFQHPWLGVRQDRVK